jgi:AmiR/NasT family two-component response regulator
MSRPLRVALADDDPRARDYLLALLARLGHDARAAPSGPALVELCRADPPDLAIADVRMPAGGGIAASLAISRQRELPVILACDRAAVAEAVEGEAIDHVMACLVKPFGEAQLRAAIALALRRFGHYVALRAEAASPEQALEDRREVERAKAALVRRLNLDEEGAFRALCERAGAAGARLVEAAREALAAEGGGPA